MTARHESFITAEHITRWVDGNSRRAEEPTPDVRPYQRTGIKQAGQTDRRGVIRAQEGEEADSKWQIRRNGLGNDGERDAYNKQQATLSYKTACRTEKRGWGYGMRGPKRTGGKQ